MTLRFVFTSCLVCDRNLCLAREQANLDELDENGGRFGSWFDHPIPAARYRDKIAPQLCDLCWQTYRDVMRGWRGRRRHGSTPPFRSIYLWACVADELAKKAKRLTISYTRQADAGRTAMARWR